MFTEQDIIQFLLNEKSHEEKFIPGMHDAKTFCIEHFSCVDDSSLKRVVIARLERADWQLIELEVSSMYYHRHRLNKTRFQVLESGMPADLDHERPRNGKGWANAVFFTKREAEIYAFAWAYAVSMEAAVKHAPSLHLGKVYNFDGFKMQVKEVETKYD